MSKPWKFLPLSLALVLAGVALLGSVAQAQDTPPPVVTPPVTAPAQTATPPAQPAAPSFQLLGKIFRDLNGPTVGGETTLQTHIESKGVTLTTGGQVKFVAKHPNKFQATVLVIQGTDAPRRFDLVSDGTRVITLRPGTKQYSLRPISPQNQGEITIEMGLLASLYFNTDLIKGIGSITAENEAALVAALRGDSIELTSGRETINGVADTVVFTLNLTKDHTKMRFFLDATQTHLTGSELDVTSEGTHVHMTERIVKQNPAPAVTATTFLVKPPAGAKKVKELTVSAFD